MTLNELISAVYVETNRPELVTETTQAVRSAILGAHGLDRFSSDMALIQYNFTVPATSVSVSLEELTASGTYPNSEFYIPLTDGSYGIYQLVEMVGADVSSLVIREVADVFSIADGAITAKLDKQLVGDVFTPGGAYATNTWRLAGKTLAMRGDCVISSIIVACYVHPHVAGDNIRSWIAEEVPYYIIHKAAAHINGAVCGKLDEAKYQLEAAKSHLPQILANIAY